MSVWLEIRDVVRWVEGFVENNELTISKLVCKRQQIFQRALGKKGKRDRREIVLNNIQTYIYIERDTWIHR